MYKLWKILLEFGANLASHQTKPAKLELTAIRRNSVSLVLVPDDHAPNNCEEYVPKEPTWVWQQSLNRHYMGTDAVQRQEVGKQMPEEDDTEDGNMTDFDDNAYDIETLYICFKNKGG